MCWQRRRSRPARPARPCSTPLCSHRDFASNPNRILCHRGPNVVYNPGTRSRIFCSRGPYVVCNPGTRNRNRILCLCHRGPYIVCNPGTRNRLCHRGPCVCRCNLGSPYVAVGVCGSYRG